MAQRKVSCEVYTDRGIVGESAYEQAVAGGYTGTKQEFEQLLAYDLTTIADGIDDVVENLPAIQAASENADKAQKWAEGADAQVTPLGGEHSSKGWADVAKGYADSIDLTNYRTSVAQDAIDITKQPKTLSESITVNGQIQTTVEEALNAINENSSIANASLSNLNEYGENHFANPGFSNITNDGKQTIVNNVMPDFETGVTFNDNTVIQAPYDCVVYWITAASTNNGAYFYISKTGSFSGEEIVFPFYINSDGYGMQSYYIPKGYYFKTSRNYASGTGSQYFKLKGAN